MKQEQDDRKEMADIDRQRQEALQRLKQKHETAIQETKGDQSLEQIGATGEAQIEVVKARDKGAMERQEDAQAHADVQFDDKMLFDREQKALDRASKEKIAEIGATARSKGSTDPKVKAMMERFVPKILTVAEAQENGLTADKDQPAIYDEMTAAWYIQEGNKYVLPDTDAKQIARAPASAVDFLFDNPQYMTEFIKPKSEGGYGYLPLGIMSVLKAHDMAQAGMTQPTE
jgi:hypothetical protein